MSSLIKVIGALLIVSLSFWITLAVLNSYDENVGLEQNVDRGGNDYRDFDLPTDASPQVCRQLCLKEDECRAFAFGRPAAEGKNSHCWLKNSVQGPSPKNQTVSGVVRP
jgi:hypothetical protein